MRSWHASTIGGLIDDGVITIHKDGNHGSNYPRIDDFEDDGFCFLTAKSLSDWRIDLDGSPRLSKRKAAELKFGFVAPGDVLLSHNATVGRVAIVPENAGPAVIGTSLTQFRLDQERLLPRFLALYFSSREFQNELSFTMAQTTRNQVPITEQRRLRVRVPPMDVQRSIADAAFCLIEKIELNRRVNETLEAMAQAIFRDWFVDFGPVRRKLSGATDPVEILGKVTTDPVRASELARLFPDGLDQDGLPSGWRQGTARDLIEFNPRETMRGGTLAPYSDMASLPTQGTVAELPVMRPFGSGMRFRNGDALLARITPCLENGKGAWVDFLSDDAPVGWGSTEFIVLRGRAGTPPLFGYLLTRDPDFRRHAIQSMTGTSGRQRAQAESLEAWPIALPPPSVLEAFGEHVNPLFARITAAAKESRILGETRDYLLPRLMSGEVRVHGMAQEIAA